MIQHNVSAVSLHREVYFLLSTKPYGIIKVPVLLNSLALHPLGDFAELGLERAGSAESGPAFPGPRTGLHNAAAAGCVSCDSVCPVWREAASKHTSPWRSVKVEEKQQKMDGRSSAGNGGR